MDFEELFPVNQTSWTKKTNKKQNHRQGKFTDEEIDKIKDSLKNYALAHNLSEDEFSTLLTNSQKTTMPKAWLEIAKVLPERTVDSVYKFIKAKFNPDNYQGHWTKEEEANLIQLIEMYGRNYTKISKEMNRTPQNIRDKYRQLGDHNHELRDLVWTLGEAVHLLRLVSKLRKVDFIQAGWQEKLTQRFGEEWSDVPLNTSSQRKRFRKITYYQILQDESQVSTLIDIVDLQKFYSVDTKNIPWNKLSEIIKTKSTDDLRNFWFQSLNQWKLLSTKSIDEQKLLNDILLQDPEYEEEINFDMVLKNSGCSKTEKQDVWNTLKKRVQLRDQLEFNELLGQMRKYISNSKKEQKQQKVEQKFKKQTAYDVLLDEYKQLKQIF